jgi:hypothetical protein
MTGGDRPLVSATQIQLYRDCVRKWGFKYIDRVEVPKHPGALLGTDVQDTQIDPYLATGREFEFTRPSGEIALALKTLLPAPKTAGLVLRRKFLIPSPSGRFEYQGEFDVWASDSGVVPGIDGGRPLVGDIKTTSNLAYALTPETLATNVQAQLYATVSMVEDDANELDLVWWYVRTRRPHRAQRVHLRVSGAHVVEQFGEIEATASELVAIRGQKPAVNELKPNARMCDAYGGCPFRNRCNLSPAVFAAAVNEAEMSNATNSFLANLRKAIPSNGAPPAPATMTVNAAAGTGYVVPQVVAAPAPLDVAASDAALVGSFTPPSPSELPAWATAPVDPLTARRNPAPINPPESALPPAQPVGTAAPAAKKRGRPAKVVAAHVAGVEAAAAPIIAIIPAHLEKVFESSDPATASATLPDLSERMANVLSPTIDPLYKFPRAAVAAALRQVATWLEQSHV